MREGFLFGVGFCAVYFSFYYGCQAVIYILTKWEYRISYNRQMKAAKAANLAGAQGQAHTHREYSN